MFRLFWFSFILLISNIAFNQTSSQQLEKAVLLFEEFKEYTSSDATDFDIIEQEFIFDEAIKLLQEVKNNGNTEEIKAANYFELILKFEYAVSSVYIKEYEQAYEDFKKIENNFLDYNYYNFPITYTRENSNYIIKWENFTPIQTEYYSLMTEVCFNLYKQDDLISYFNLYRNSSNRTDYMDYVTYNLLLESIDPSGMFGDLLKSIQSIGNEKPKFSDLEMTEFALAALKSFDKLPIETKNGLVEKNINTTQQALITLLKYTNTNDSKSLSNLADGAFIIAKNNPKQKNLLKAFDISIDNYSKIQLNNNQQDFLRKSIEIAELYVEQSKDSSKKIGLNSNKLLSNYTYNCTCEFYSEIASNYTFWNEISLANEYLLKYNSCIHERDKLAKKNARIAKRAASNTNFYLGAYVLPLINTNKKRDYGGVLNITNNKLSYEFSYLKIAQNKENTFDLWIKEVDGSSQKDFSLWNGYYTHFQLKIHENKEAPYIGILVGYANKDFEPYKVNVIDNTTLSMTSVQFNPSVNQYIGMLNFGIMKLRKGVGIDAYYGFGVNYSQFSNGTTIDRTLNTIQNPSLQNRKDTYFGFIMRFGLTFGLNFGQGN